MIEFPSRVWEPVGTKIIDGKEVTIWSSHEPSDEDKLRRKLLKHGAEKRVYEMKLRIEEEERRQFENEWRRKWTQYRLMKNTESAQTQEAGMFKNTP